jgi:hypothetical protein
VAREVVGAGEEEEEEEEGGERDRRELKCGEFLCVRNG